MSSPKQAAELLHNRRFEAAMDALLAAWRTHRAPQLERAIAALSDHLAGGVEAIDVEADDWQGQWERRARDKRAVELGVLLPHVTRPPKGGIPRRVRGILGFGGDPRIAAVLLDIIENPPTTASSNFSMWTELFAALPDHLDARAKPRLEARAAEKGGKSQFWSKLEAWIVAVVPRLGTPASLPAAWKPELEQLHEAIAALANQPAPDLRAAALDPVEWTEVDDLAQIRAQLDAGKLAAALDLLVSYWGQRRSPTIAALIDRLGVLVDEQQDPPGGRTAKARHEAWLAAGERPRPSAVGPLLAALREGKLADVEARLELLPGWQPDPRVASAMLLFVKDYMLGARNRLWKAVFDALLHHGDPRVAEDIRKRHDHLANAHVLHRHIAEGRELRRVFERFCELVEADHELSADQVEHADAIANFLAERIDDEGPDDLERGLVESVVDAWDDDAPRLVYADWLQSRNDPRGEFIALDVALTQGKKVKGAREKYFRSHKEALFGPLAGLMTYGERFERGLLVHARISTRKGGLDVGEDRRREILSDLRWAQLRSIDVSYDDVDVAEVFERAPLLALEQLGRPGLAALQGFARRSDTVPVRSLSVSGSPTDSDEAWEQFGALARTLPQAESLEIMIWGREGGRVTPPVACFRGELCRRAKLLVNGSERTGGVARLDEWLERMVSAKCPTPCLRIIGPELSAEVRQVELGRFEVELSLDRLRQADRPEAALVLDVLRGLPRANIARMTVRLVNIGDDVRPEIEAALGGLPV